VLHFFLDEDMTVTQGSEETLIFNETNVEFRGIMIAPGEGKLPVPFFRDTDAEELSFPTIYCGLRRQYSDDFKITTTDIIKSEIRRFDRRACNPTHLLYAFKKSYNEKVRQAVQIYLRKTSETSKLSAGQARNPEFIEKMVKQDHGYAVFKNIRSSPAYLEQKNKTARSMVRQLGKCAFFITLSAAETKWNELLVSLTKILRNKDITEEEAEQLSFDEKSHLIRSDPVTCMRHFERKSSSLLTTMFKKEKGIQIKISQVLGIKIPSCRNSLFFNTGIFAPYKMTDYFTRLEFQMRGSPHLHGLYWIKNAPAFIPDNEQSIKDCEKFIDEFITCERADTEPLKSLIGYQVHKHSHTCHKSRHRDICRFGFPKPPMKKTQILEPLEAVSVEEKKAAKRLFKIIQEDLTKRGRFAEDNPDFDTYLMQLAVTEADYLQGNFSLYLS